MQDVSNMSPSKHAEKKAPAKTKAPENKVYRFPVYRRPAPEPAPAPAPPPVEEAPKEETPAPPPPPVWSEWQYIKCDLWEGYWRASAQEDGQYTPFYPQIKCLARFLTEEQVVGCITSPRTERRSGSRRLPSQKHQLRRLRRPKLPVSVSADRRTPCYCLYLGPLMPLAFPHATIKPYTGYTHFPPSAPALSCDVFSLTPKKTQHRRRRRNPRHPPR